MLNPPCSCAAPPPAASSRSRACSCCQPLMSALCSLPQEQRRSVSMSCPVLHRAAVRPLGSAGSAAGSMPASGAGAPGACICCHCCCCHAGSSVSGSSAGSHACSTGCGRGAASGAAGSDAAGGTEGSRLEGWLAGSAPACHSCPQNAAAASCCVSPPADRPLLDMLAVPPAALRCRAAAVRKADTWRSCRRWRSATPPPGCQGCCEKADALAANEGAPRPLASGLKCVSPVNRPCGEGSVATRGEDLADLGALCLFTMKRHAAQRPGDLRLAQG